MNKLLAVLALAVLIAGCTQTAPAQQPSQPSNEQTAPVAPNTILIQNFAFSPATLTVASGTSVTWINKDSTGHTVVGEGFSSSTINHGETFMNQFTAPGTYAYHCGIHPTMAGTIIVT